MREIRTSGSEGGDAPMPPWKPLPGHEDGNVGYRQAESCCGVVAPLSRCAPGKAWSRRTHVAKHAKPRNGTQRVPNPARPRLTASRKRVLCESVRKGRPQSVDSEHASRVIEPRNAQSSWWSRIFNVRRRQHRSAAMVWHRGPPGVQERSGRAWGFPRNLG